MSNRTPIRVRGAILGIFTLLALGLVLPRVVGQVRPGGLRPLSPPGNPMQGAPPSGLIPPGGYGNTPPGGNFPGQPPMPNYPTMPQSPMPNFPSGPLIERVWTCEKCGKEVGRGNFPPATCQHCGVRLINGIGGGDRPIGSGGTGMTPPTGMMPPGGTMTPPSGMMPPGGTMTPPSGMMPPGGGMSPTPNVGYAPVEPATYPQTPYSPSSTSSPSTPLPTTSTGPSVGRILIIVAAIVTAVMVLIVAIIVVVIIVSRNAAKRPAKRTMRRRSRMRD